MSKDKLRNSRKSEQGGVARAVKINADVLNADLDHDDHSQQGARDKNLSSKANRIHHRRSSRRNIRNFCSSCSPRRRRSKDALKDTVSPRRSRKHWIKPDRYDGSSSLEAFLAHFNTCATYNRWREDDRLAHLRSCLTGRAVEILWANGENASDTLDKLLAILRNRFGNDGQAEKHRAELRCRHRRPGESLYVQCFMTFRG